jgi:hypothetical protein
MNRRAFVSINRMRAGHISLKASLKKKNIVSTAECECGDGLQTEEHIFWDCKRYEEQRATMVDFCLRTAKISYSLPSLFSGVSFEESTYASYLSAPCQGFSVRIISMICELAVIFCPRSRAFICPSL